MKNSLNRTAVELLTVSVVAVGTVVNVVAAAAIANPEPAVKAVGVCALVVAPFAKIYSLRALRSQLRL